MPEGLTLAELAQRWCLDFAAVTTIIPGATRIAQVEANVAVSALPSLSPSLHAELREFYTANVENAIRGPY